MLFSNDRRDETALLSNHIIRSRRQARAKTQVFSGKMDTLRHHLQWETLMDFFANFQNNLLPSGEKSLEAKSLVIESVDRHEAGIYICEARNGVGHKSATATIKLQVLCK